MGRGEDDHWAERGKFDHQQAAGWVEDDCWVGRGEDDCWAERGEFHHQQCECIFALKQVLRAENLLRMTRNVNVAGKNLEKHCSDT